MPAHVDPVILSHNHRQQPRALASPVEVLGANVPSSYWPSYHIGGVVTGDLGVVWCL
jgi:hypothetical protein